MKNLKYPLLHYSKIMFSDSRKGVELWSYHIKFLLRTTYYWSAFRYLVNNIPPSLLDILCERYKLLDKPLKPYITNNYTAMQRSELLVQHFNFVQNVLSEQLKHNIYYDNGFTLLLISVESLRYSFELVSGIYGKEGDMSLVLLSDSNERFYTLTFSLRDIDGYRDLIIGGLQGPKSSAENTLKIKEFTKKLDGQRPKDLMIKIITMVAKYWMIDRIMAVKNSTHSYCSIRYSKGRIKTDLDEHWISLGGTEFNHDFYMLPINYEHRDISTISRSKRAMYRRRYKWIEDINSIIDTRLDN